MSQGGFRIVPQSIKHFAERLNSCLDDMGAPGPIKERAVVLGKMLNIPRQQAWALLEGHQIPDRDFLLEIANEFEVDPDWLAGEK